MSSRRIGPITASLYPIPHLTQVSMSASETMPRSTSDRHSRRMA